MRNLSWIGIAIFGFYLNCSDLNSQNLVVNPSFETYSSCPTTASQVTRATPWQAARHSPEYMHTCGGNQYCLLPNNYWGNEPAATGNACMGGLFYGSFASSYLVDLREFLYGNLTSPLVAGQTYYVSFQANLADKSSHAVNNLGVQFTSTYNSMFPLNNGSHVYTTSIVNQKNGWTQISGTFVPSTAYSNIMIGNFHTDANTAVQSVGPVQIGYNAYYFIDDVCVSLNPGVCSTVLPADWGDLTVEAENGMQVKLGWSTQNEKNTDRFEIERSIDGVNFKKVAEQEAAGSSNKTLQYAATDKPMYYGRVFYRIRLIDQNGSTHLSKVLEIVMDESLSDFFLASPNPVGRNGLLSVYLDRDISGNVRFEWLDGAGRMVQSKNVDIIQGNGMIHLSVSNLAPGAYRLKVTSGSRCRTQPIIILE